MQYEQLEHLLLREKEVIEAYCTMFDLSYEPYGWNMKDAADPRPDFIVDNKKVEIKIQDLFEDGFLLCENLSVYVRYDSYLLLVQGYCTSKPIYMLLTPVMLRSVFEKGKEAYRTGSGSVEYYFISATDYEFKDLSLEGIRYPALPKGDYTFVRKRYGSVDFKFNGFLSSVGSGAFTRHEVREKNGVDYFYDFDKRKFPRDTVQVMLGDSIYHFSIHDFYVELSRLGLNQIAKHCKDIF